MILDFLLFAAGIFFLAWALCWVADHDPHVYMDDDEPMREIVPANERCMVEYPSKCNEPAAAEIHGWRLCAGHLLERVCNVMECDQAARHDVTRHGHALRVCTDCHDEGHALGLWDAEVSA